MKALVIYDSMYGNTEKVARAISKALKCEVKPVESTLPQDLNNLNLLVVGSPTQGGRPTQKLTDFLNTISPINFKVATFDTRFAQENQTFFLRTLMKTIGFAAPKIAGNLKRKGGHLVKPPEGFIVTDTKGPLADKELTRAGNWALTLLLP
jgi:flavodoxin I